MIIIFAFEILPVGGRIWAGGSGGGGSRDINREGARGGEGAGGGEGTRGGEEKEVK